MAQDRRIRAEERLGVVRRYLNGTLGILEASRETGANYETIRTWIARYEAEGEAAFLPHEKNRVYPPEEKRQAVQDYLSGGGSLLDVCKKHKIRSKTQLQNWLKVYTAHGDLNLIKQSGGGSYMKQGRDTTQEERIQIVKDCIEHGKNYGEMALKYTVSYQQVRTWTLRFEALGVAGLEDRRGRRTRDQMPRTELEQAQVEIEQLKHKLYLSEMENALLKKLEEVERRDAFRK